MHLAFLVLIDDMQKAKQTCDVSFEERLTLNITHLVPNKSRHVIPLVGVRFAIIASKALPLSSRINLFVSAALSRSFSATFSQSWKKLNNVKYVEVEVRKVFIIMD